MEPWAYDVRLVLELDASQSWLDVICAQATSVRALLEAIASPIFINGFDVKGLNVDLAKEVRLHWTIPSEIWPEVSQVIEHLWSVAISHPLLVIGGMFAHRDAYGPLSLWDRVEVLERGVVVRVDRWLDALVDDAASSPTLVLDDISF